MKRSKPTSLSKTSTVRSRSELVELQRQVGGAIMRSLTPRWSMDKRSQPVADAFIKPNDRLSSFERLEIYNRQYWFRIIDCLYDDYPGLHAVVGDRKFSALARAYLRKYPSTSFTLRDLGQHLETFLRQEPHWARPRNAMARDMVRLEWARVVAFDAEARPDVAIDELLGANPSRLRLQLQPHLSILNLRYPVDDYLIALKKLNTDALRGEASNAVTEHAHKHVRKLRHPRPVPICVAVHRINNAVYYKRLTREQFAVLDALRQGRTLEQACARVTKIKAEQLGAWFEAWASFGWFCRPC